MLGMPNEHPGTERRIIHMARDGDATHGNRKRPHDKATLSRATLTKLRCYMEFQHRSFSLAI